MLRSLVAALATLLCATCNAQDDHRAKPTSAPAATAALESFPPKPKATRPTATSAEIAMHNLSAQIDDARKTLGRRPRDLSVRITLFELLLQRASVLDHASDLIEAAAIADSAPHDFPDERDAYLLKFRGLTARHKFVEARAWFAAEIICSTATKAPTASCPRWKPRPDDDAQKEWLMAKLDLATGRYEDAERVFAKRSLQAKTSQNLHFYALVLGAMGRSTEADLRFVEAETAYRDVSPFPLAEIRADRATMWQRSGELTKATEHFEVASLLLPQHVHIATHLAALRTPSEAISLLTPLCNSGARPTESADLWSTLGTYRDMTQGGSGAAELETAKQRYEELVRLLPEAYADHAAWFWLGPGNDKTRASQLAQINLRERQTSEAYELALRAATDSGNRDLACETGIKARAYQHPSDLLLLYLKQLADCPSPATTRPSDLPPIHP